MSIRKNNKNGLAKVVLKKVGIGIAGAGTLALAGFTFLLGSSKRKDIYDFENDTDDVHYIDWDDYLDDDHEPDEEDESGGAEDYYSSRPYTDE